MTFTMFGLSVAQGDVIAAERQLETAREQRLTEIRSARAQGASYGQIARAMGVNRETPRMILTRAGEDGS